jgi:hypothetical protein
MPSERYRLASARGLIGGVRSTPPPYNNGIEAEIASLRNALDQLIAYIESHPLLAVDDRIMGAGDGKA